MTSSSPFRDWRAQAKVASICAVDEEDVHGVWHRANRIRPAVFGTYRFQTA